MSKWFIRRANVVYSTGGGGGLPAEFTELAYLQGTGTQYIDTGIYGKLATEIRAKIYVTSYGNLFGDMSNTSASISSSYSPGRVTYTRFGDKRVASAFGDCSYDVDCVIKENKDGVWVDNVQTATFSATSSFTTSNTLLLFKCNGASGIPQFRCYYFEVYEDGAAVLKLVPAKRNSDNVVGMYDLVSRSFLTNAGSGSFLYGEL